MNTTSSENRTDITKIKMDVEFIRGLLEGGKYATSEKVTNEVEKINSRINKTIIGLSGVLLIMGGCLAYFLKNGS